jgi:dipeptide/tripeptide permease
VTLDKLIDVFMNIALMVMIGCVIAFFVTKKPKFGYVAAILLAAIPVVQLIGMYFAPPIKVDTETARLLAVPLIFLFDAMCFICAGVMYRVAKKREDWM